MFGSFSESESIGFERTFDSILGVGDTVGIPGIDEG